MSMFAISRLAAVAGAVAVVWAGPVLAQTRIRIVPPAGASLAVGQRVDIRVEAEAPPGAAAVAGPLTVAIDGTDVTARNVLDEGLGGLRGAGGAGKTGGPPLRAVAAGPKTSANFLLQDYAFADAGRHTIVAKTGDGATASARLEVLEWNAPRPGAARARNIILFLGDGLSAAHRTAARILARGVTRGKADGPLEMDRLPVTGQVTTFSLNSVITDSSPGMAAYVTGHKSSNNQEGVYPDNTPDPFDNPRVEYVGEFLRRVRGPGFNVGIVTTADVTDATPGSNAVHTAARGAAFEIAARFFDERSTNGVTVLMGGGRANFLPKEKGGRRGDRRDLVTSYQQQGYRYVTDASGLRTLLEAATAPPAVLGLFHSSHMSVAFDKVGAGRYSLELAAEANAALRDQPMLDDMTRLALRSLATHSSEGFFLMVEGASIDKQSHAVDPERSIWDVIELDNAVGAALEFAERTNTDADPANDTLVIVTADHETGGFSIIGVGNERYRPQTLGVAVRDYAAVFRFAPEQELEFFPNYQRDANGFPLDPDPSRKLLIGWAAAPDHYENWISNRHVVPPTIDPRRHVNGAVARVAVANPARDGEALSSDNTTTGGQRIPGFLVPGTIENGAHACSEAPHCPADTSSVPHTISGHTGSDVPLSAYGPGMVQFTGTYDNTDVFIKMLRAATGTYELPQGLLPARRGGAAP
jgi:alkaline phosphatase